MPDNQNKRVESWELLNLAFMDRADALELADRAAAQTREEQFNKTCDEKWEEWVSNLPPYSRCETLSAFAKKLRAMADGNHGEKE